MRSGDSKMRNKCVTGLELGGYYSGNRIFAKTLGGALLGGIMLLFIILMVRFQTFRTKVGDTLICKSDSGSVVLRILSKREIQRKAELSDGSLAESKTGTYSIERLPGFGPNVMKVDWSDESVPRYYRIGAEGLVGLQGKSGTETGDVFVYVMSKDKIE
jgi:hypothetical protein